MCPLGRETCEGCRFIKENLCDWPYMIGLGYEGIKEITARYNRKLDPLDVR